MAADGSEKGVVHSEALAAAPWVRYVGWTPDFIMDGFEKTFASKYSEPSERRFRRLAEHVQNGLT
jgi:hypothetical protein